MTLLELKKLKVYYKTKKEYAKAVDDVTLDIQMDESLGLVGESGCGKTTLARAIIRVFSPNCDIVDGQILYKGKDITNMSEKELRALRWEEISMIPQSAMNALDPVYRVGHQIIEAIVAHGSVGRRKAVERAEQLFTLVGLPPERLRDYPHQFSGGMRQRAIIAMALALEPALVIADEPTTGLDVIMQDEIWKQVREIRLEHHGAMLLVTHNMAVVSENCDRVAIMYAGKIVEIGPRRDVLTLPYHPYTLGLSNAFPRIKGSKRELISIPGTPPDLLNPPKGCRFSERCPFVLPICEEREPPTITVHEGHLASCHRMDDIDQIRSQAKDPEVWIKYSKEGKKRLKYAK